ncbi:MAG: heavy-metal-associated domain-containing protein [Planctomycetes bacterium]|nr:heavy-metal-associated domain-containing protein [Planctomycetota bacterium]
MADQKRREETGKACEIELRVSGMSCQGCEQALSMALRQHDAVESAQADARSGVVRVTVKRDVDASELKERIYAAGYDVE